MVPRRHNLSNSAMYILLHDHMEVCADVLHFMVCLLRVAVVSATKPTGIFFFFSLLLKNGLICKAFS